jgi:hypothetical protein
MNVARRSTNHTTMPMTVASVWGTLCIAVDPARWVKACLPPWRAFLPWAISYRRQEVITIRREYEKDSTGVRRLPGSKYF